MGGGGTDGGWGLLFVPEEICFPFPRPPPTSMISRHAHNTSNTSNAPENYDRDSNNVSLAQAYRAPDSGNDEEGTREGKNERERRKLSCICCCCLFL